MLKIDQNLIYTGFLNENVPKNSEIQPFTKTFSIPKLKMYSLGIVKLGPF